MSEAQKMVQISTDDQRVLSEAWLRALNAEKRGRKESKSMKNALDLAHLGEVNTSWALERVQLWAKAIEAQGEAVGLILAKLRQIQG